MFRLNLIRQIRANAEFALKSACGLSELLRLALDLKFSVQFASVARAKFSPKINRKRIKNEKRCD